MSKLISPEQFLYLTHFCIYYNHCIILVKMELRLTVNGIDKIIGSLNGIVVQIISVQQKFQNNQYFYSCEFNDGYCKMKGCIIDTLQKIEKSKLKDMMVIKVLKSAMQKTKKQKLIIIVEQYELFHEKVKGLIGNPIPYEDYIKNGKNNPEGDNLIQIEKGAQINKKQHKSIQVQAFQQSKNNDENTRTNKPPTKAVIQANQKPNNQLNNQKPAINQPENSKSNVSRQKSVDQRPKQGPIQRLNRKEQPKIEPVPSGKQKKPNSEYTQIRSLYIGMENWVVLGRIIAINPLKTFINKKGVQSFLLAFQIGDKSGLIECNIFGETANRFEGILKEDQIYEISNGTVGQTSYLGTHKLKITINQLSKVNIKEDDPNVPYMEDFCVTVKRLIQLPIGQEARVICLVKDDNQATTITTKDGKSLRKKIVYLCDPIDKVQVDITVWNDTCDFKFEKYPYMIKGVHIKEYQGNRQYSLKANHKVTILKQHSLRKYIKDIENISFTNPDSNNKPKRANITNFKDLNNSMDEVSKSGTWSQVICFVTAIRHSSKNYYMSCPKCKKKVTQIENANCVNCDHFYDTVQYRYILSLNVADYFDSIWITAYDESAEILMGLSAQQFATMKQEEVQQHMKKIRYKPRKLRLVTKNQEFNGTTRKKTNIIKIMQLNFAEETKIILQKVKKLIAAK